MARVSKDPEVQEARGATSAARGHWQEEDGNTVVLCVGQELFFVSSNQSLQGPATGFIGSELQLAACLFCVGHEGSHSDTTWSLPARCKSAGLQLVWEKEVEVSEMELRNVG